MAWQRCHGDVLTLPPTPWRVPNTCYPSYLPTARTGYACGGLDYQYERDHIDVRGQRAQFRTLQDRSLADHAGDLGWSLDYATAWCYKHLLDNQPDIADALDFVREIEDVEPSTPFVIFDRLDQVLFRHKLKSMVYLCWEHRSSCSSGVTSAPGIVGTRVTIQLNSTPFMDEDEDRGIDDLLEALIHHMIHAFFLVCCGAQKRGGEQDGRLLDGVHFGVLLLTIKDISNDSPHGPLNLIFHASKRRQLEGDGLMNQLIQYNQPPILAAHRYLEPYISMTPQGRALAPPPADGRSHCLHDNRNVSGYQIKNWQVQEYAKALAEDEEAKGDEIWDFDKKGKLEKIERLKAAASSTYAELEWDEKRVIVDREKALGFESLKKPVKKGAVKVGKCSEEILKCVHDFIENGEYDGSSLADEHGLGRLLGGLHGPPLIMAAGRIRDQPKCDVLTHVQVYKTAKEMEFEELAAHAMRRLDHLPITNQDPIEILKEVYDVKEAGTGPVAVDPLLHRFARRWLLQGNDVTARFGIDNPARRLLQQRNLLAGGGGGMSNLEQIRAARFDEFQDLYYRSPAFREDVRLISGDDEGFWNEPAAGNLLARRPLGLGGLGAVPPLRLTNQATDNIRAYNTGQRDGIEDGIGMRAAPMLGLAGAGLGRAGGDDILDDLLDGGGAGGLDEFLDIVGQNPLDEVLARGRGAGAGGADRARRRRRAGFGGLLGQLDDPLLARFRQLPL